MIDPAVLDALLEAGATAEMIVAAVKADAVMERARLDNRRSKDRDRQRRHRESRDVTVTNGDTADVTSRPVTPALEVSPENPLPKTTPSPPYNPPASRKRGTRLADDFEPPEDWIAWAMKKRGWDREEAADECECFVRYWQAKPGREACKLDWPKTWQNWAVNSRRKPKAQSPPVGAWDGMA